MIDSKLEYEWIKGLIKDYPSVLQLRFADKQDKPYRCEAYGYKGTNVDESYRIYAFKDDELRKKILTEWLVASQTSRGGWIYMLGWNWKPEAERIDYMAITREIIGR